MVVTCTNQSKVSSSVIPPIMATVDGSGKKYQGLSKSWTEFKKINICEDSRSIDTI